MSLPFLPGNSFLDPTVSEYFGNFEPVNCKKLVSELSCNVDSTSLEAIATCW